MADNVMKLIFDSNPQVIDAMIKKIEDLRQEMADADALFKMGGVTNDDYTNTLKSLGKQMSSIQKDVDAATVSLKQNAAATAKAAEEAQKAAEKQAQAASRAAKEAAAAARKAEYARKLESNAAARAAKEVEGAASRKAKAEERAAKASEEAMAKAARSITSKVKSGSYAIQDFAATSGDFGQKLNSVSNNLMTFAESFGLVGIGVGVTATLLIEAYKNWDSITSLWTEKNPFPVVGDTVEVFKERVQKTEKALEDLREKGYGSTDQIKNYILLTKELKVAKEQEAKAIKDAEAAKKATENTLNKDDAARKKDIGDTVTEFTAGNFNEIAKGTLQKQYEATIAETNKQIAGIDKELGKLGPAPKTANEQAEEDIYRPEIRARREALQDQRFSAVKRQGAGLSPDAKEAYMNKARTDIGYAMDGDQEAIKRLADMLPDDNKFKGKLLQSLTITDADVVEDEKDNQKRLEKRKEDKKKKDALDKKKKDALDKQRAEDKRLADKRAEGLSKDSAQEQELVKKFQPIANAGYAQIEQVRQFDPRQANQMRRQFDANLSDELMSAATKEVGLGKAEGVRSHVQAGLQEGFRQDLGAARQPAVKEFGKQEGTAVALQQVIGVATEMASREKESQAMLSRLLGMNQENRQGNRTLKSQMNR